MLTHLNFAFECVCVFQQLLKKVSFILKETFKITLKSLTIVVEFSISYINFLNILFQKYDGYVTR